MADGAVAQLDGIGWRDQVLAGIGNGERNKVVGAMASAAESAAGTAPDEALQIGVGDPRFAPRRIADPIRSLAHGDLRGHLLRMPQLDLRTAGHEIVFYSSGVIAMMGEIAQGGRGGSGRVFGFPLEGFSLFQSLLLSCRIGILHFLLDDVHCHLRSAGVERARRPLGELR